MSQNGFERRKKMKMKAIENMTLELLKELPVKKLSMDVLAERAQVSKATIFKYYDTKENLINIVLLSYMNQMHYEYEQLLQSDGSFSDLYMKMMALKWSYMSQMSEQLMENLVTQYSESPAFLLKSNLLQSDDLLIPLLRKGRLEGVINPDYSDEFLLNVLTIYSEGMKHVVQDKAFMEEHAVSLGEFFLNSLKK